MEATHQINSKDYVKLMFSLAYRKPVFIFLFLSGFFLVFKLIDSIATGKFMYLELSTRYFIVMMIIYIFIISPLMLFIRFRNAFKTNKGIGEKITTTITCESIKHSAESYISEIEWNVIHKIRELKSWFLFYHNNISFGFLPKKDLSEEQILELRTLIRNSGVKAKLLKS